MQDKIDYINQIVKSYIKEYGLESPDITYLVAFSGGYDSMCLLHVLKSISKNKIVAIHLNHNWRGDESDSEEQNCRNFCKTQGIEFYSEKLSDDIEKNETAAREERYKFFERCANKFRSNLIFTAHNKNDNAETVLYRIAKGTGIVGLQGIAPRRDIYYRPLLTVGRADIEKYCKQNNLTPNNDSSNEDVIHKRNLIRKEILPLLSQINENAIDSLNKLSLAAVEDAQIINEYLEIIKNNICKGDKFKTEEYLKLSKALQMRILYELVAPLVPQNYDRERISVLHDFIEQNKTSKSGKICSVTSGYDLFVSDKFFEFVTAGEKNNITVKIDKSGEYDCGSFKFKISECNEVSADFVYGDYRKIYADLSDYDINFELRNRKDGDIIQPFGMSGHQKLKKYLNSKKIPNHEKDNLIMLTCGNEVLWVCGIGTSEKIKVKTKPTHKLEIEEKNGNKKRRFKSFIY